MHVVAQGLHVRGVNVEISTYIHNMNIIINKVFFQETNKEGEIQMRKQTFTNVFIFVTDVCGRFLLRSTTNPSPRIIHPQ